MDQNSAATVEQTQAGETSSERALADLWKRADTLAEGLTTKDGRRLQVIYPGRASSRAGPDFRDAIIATEDGDRLTGDVELHLRAPDWYAHGHDVDPGYNGVILHVVLWPKGESISWQQSRMNAPVVVFPPDAHMLDHGKASRRHRMSRPDGVGQGALGDILDRAGDERFLARSRGFAIELADAEPEQVLYAALMEVLGYSSNRKPFRELSKCVPVASLGQLRSEPATTRLMALKAMLLRAAGLLSHLEPSDEARRLKRLLRHLPGSKPMSKKEWRLFRVRPANHPVSRIIGAAHLVDRYIDTGLVGGLAMDVRREDAKSLLQGVIIRPFIGEGRAGDMVINAVLPFMHAWAGTADAPSLGVASVRLYQGMPKLQDNEITREMRRILGPEYDDLPTINARRQQGLMHIYKRLVKHR